MLRLCAFVLLAVVSAVGADFAARAARPPESAALTGGTGTELVVFEVDGCAYCSVFRRDVLPAWQQSPRAAEVPICFVDLNDPLARKVTLESPVDVVPTVVLMMGDREAGRITGYAGPDHFFQFVRQFLPRSE